MNNVTDMNELKKKSRTRFVLSLVSVGLLFVLMASGDVLLIIFSPERFILNLVLAILISCIVIWAVIFYFANLYAPLRYMNELCRRYSKFNESEGYFTVLEAKKTVKNKVEFASLKVSYLDGGSTYTRDLLMFSDVRLTPGTKIKAKLYQNFLIGYEVNENEND